MRRPDLRIRVQLTVSVCLFTVVCVISLAVAIYVLSRNTLLNIQIGNLDLNSRMLQEECRQEFEDIFENFYRLSYSTPVQRIYENYTNSDLILNAANVLHDSFGPDRILLLKLYLKNGTEILEVDSRSVSGSSNIPQSILPISNAGANLNNTLNTINEQYGLFMGPARAGDNFNGASYVLSLSLPIKNDSVYTQSGYSQGGQSLVASRGKKNSITRASASNGSTSAGGIIGYATFLVNCLKLQKTLSSISQGSASNEIGAAALCVEQDNFTEFQQLIPFNDNTTNIQNLSAYGDSTSQSAMKWLSRMPKPNIQAGDNFYISPDMAETLREGSVPSAGVNKGPDKSMISISPFTVLYSTYYVVVLQSHNAVFSMLHSLRRIIIIASCVIGAGMIIFTFLFVSFGARQILRLKMAATYEEAISTKWKFLSIPWWLRSSNRKKREEIDDKSEFQVPEQVPLRKHVRDELDDITERFNTMSNELRKQYELLEDRVEARKAEIEQAREAADIANAAKSHFLARVTHELRTPLNGIIGTATLCLQEDNIQQIHHSLRTIFKCGELLLHLMTDLLSFSQNEVENLNLEMRDFTLVEITSQLKAIFTEQCVTKKIKLVVDSCEQYEHLVFSGDTNRISQVIFNLMSNGIKFTPEGGEVYFHAEVKDNLEVPNTKLLTFYVRDNGPGIAPEMQARVFEAFVQGNISKQSKKAGVGLGLSICRQLAERMDGTITLKSDLGRGSVFIFELPLTFRVVDAGSPASQALLDSSSISSRMMGSPSRSNFASAANAAATPSSSDLSALVDFPASPTSGGTASTDPASKSSPTSGEKSGESAAPKRSVFTRTFSSTSQLTRGFLTSSRRRTQESIFRTKDISKDTAKDASKNSSEQSEPPLPVSPMETTPEQEHHSPHRSPTGEPGKSAEHSKAGVPYPIVTKKPSLLRKRSSNPSPTTQTDAKKLESPFETPLPEQPQPLKLALPDAHNAVASPSLVPRPSISAKKSFIAPLSADIKVLVVDDNSVNQEVMVRMLNLEGLKSIKVANDGLDAIEKVREALSDGNDFDVIFMDVQMPNMDGRQATRIIRNELKLSVPIVAVSAFANEKNADDCIAAGMNLFLSKPLRRPHLREILRSLTSNDDSDENNINSKGE